METKIMIIISVITISTSLVFSQQNTPAVVDVDGNQLQTNTKYYIFSRGGGGGGGGLALSVRDRRSPCPPNVVQENDASSKGLSLKIFPVDKKEALISTQSDLNFVFMGATTCVQSTVWKVGSPDPFTRQRYVRSGGVLGRPGAETVGNWFKIERSGEGYKIVYCPSVCSSCKVECGEVGLFEENGHRWLGIGGQPLVFGFNKVGSFSSLLT
ncbi:hypothetical protein ACS0TY_002087 [Phlomoides rotata]